MDLAAAPVHIAIMMLKNFFARALGLRQDQSRDLDAIRSMLLSYVQTHGHVTPNAFLANTFPQDRTPLLQHLVLQAAQILVNRGELTASKNGKKVDPLNSDLTIILQIPQI